MRCTIPSSLRFTSMGSHLSEVVWSSVAKLNHSPFAISISSQTQNSIRTGLLNAPPLVFIEDVTLDTHDDCYLQKYCLHYFFYKPNLYERTFHFLPVPSKAHAMSS